MSPEFNINDVYQALAITPSGQYQIRPMYQTDIDTVVDLERIIWPTDPWSSGIFFEVLNDSDWNCWILESTNNDHLVLGYGVQSIQDSDTRISNLCIDPKHRGYGLGGILLRHMINYARRLATSTVRLKVHTSNSHAYRLYINHGFRKAQILRQYYFDGSDAYEMTLLL
jgi:ribosomal-protein-alanine N-acetyltransferase